MEYNQAGDTFATQIEKYKQRINIKTMPEIHHKAHIIFISTKIIVAIEINFIRLYCLFICKKVLNQPATAQTAG